MKTAYIFHDSFCDPYSEWYPWMKTTLENRGYLVIVPKFPSPAGQSFESWQAVIKKYLGTFDNETLFIGHGTGGLFAMRILSEMTQSIRGLFLVASYGEPIGNIGYDRINTTFYEPALDFEKVKAHAGIIAVFAGQDDPFIPAAISERLAENLTTPVITIPEGGHIGRAAGFTELVVVASHIMESLQIIDQSMTIESPTAIPTPSPLPLTIPEAPVNQIPLPAHPHTMYQDMSHLMNSNDGRVASSLLSEARKEESAKNAKSIGSGKNIAYTVFSVCMVIAVVGIGWYLVNKYAPAPQVPAPVEIPSLVQSENHQKIQLSGEPIFVLVQKIQAVFNQPLENSIIKDIYYTDQNGPASFTDLLNALGVKTPLGLSDEFPISQNGSPVFMHGITKNSERTAHFLILKIKNYDITFADMKQWEPTLVRDIGPLFDISPNFLRTRLTKDIFEDALIQNKNVRVLHYHKPIEITLDDSIIQSLEKNIADTNPFANQSSPYEENDIILAYFFLNEKTMIITDDVTIIPELLRRIANRQIYQ